MFKDINHSISEISLIKSFGEIIDVPPIKMFNYYETTFYLKALISDNEIPPKTNTISLGVFWVAWLSLPRLSFPNIPYS